MAASLIWDYMHGIPGAAVAAKKTDRASPEQILLELTERIIFANSGHSLSEVKCVPVIAFFTVNAETVRGII